MSNIQKTKYTSYIICPHCKGKLAATEVKGGWLERTCPECGKSLDAAAFDNYALAVIKDNRVYAAKRDKEKDLARRHKGIASLIKNPLLKPVSFLLRKNADRHDRKKDHYAEKAGNARNEMIQLAIGRYYASEWYQLSGTALVNPDNPLGEYALHTEYGANGKPALFHDSGGAVAGGVLGEWQVFEELVAHIAGGDALFKGVRLVPNVFLPSVDEEGFKDQTDLIVLSEEAVFVCEVKNWHSEIRARQQGKSIAILKSDKNEKHDVGKPIQQIEKRMADFAALGIYPKDRIYGIVVFVNPVSLEAFDGFRKKVAVASCMSDGTGTLVSTIGAKLREKDAVLSQASVDGTAEMLANWADKDGSIAKEQVEIRDKVLGGRRQERLVALADFACARRQAGYERREEHGRKRDAAKASRKEAKSKDAKRQRHARKQRIYEIEQEYDEWDYLAC